MFWKAKGDGTKAGYRARPPRKEMSCSATLVADNRFYRAKLLNVSHRGCRVLMEGGTRPAAERVQIALEAFHSLGGAIRWFKDGEMGIEFTTPLSEHMFEKWNAELERGGPAQAVAARSHRWQDFWGDMRRPFG